MHQLMSSDDGIDGTGTAAMRAADAKGLFDECDRVANRSDLCQRNNVTAEEGCEAPHGFIAAGPAHIDRRFIGHDRFRIRPAARVTALCALCLRQKFIDLLREIAWPRR
jgi:hypothetical protein